MKVKEIMTREVEVVHPDASLQEAARKMKDLDVGSIPVCDGDTIHGILTDRDITIRATAEGRDPAHTKAREVMTPNIVFCYEDQDVEEAAQIMSEKQIRRLPILNREKRMTGIVSLGDLAVSVDKDLLSGRTLEHISTPSKPER